MGESCSISSQNEKQNLMGRDHLDDIDIDEWVLFRLILNRM